MITEKSLQEAIAYCQGKVDPKRDDAILLAACYIIEERMFGKKEQPNENQDEEPLRVLPGYSYAPPPEPVENTIEYMSDTDFGRMIHGQSAAEIWPIVDELVSEAVQTLTPRLYNAFMSKIPK